MHWVNGRSAMMETIIGLGGGPWPTFRRYQMERLSEKLPEPSIGSSIMMLPYEPGLLHDHADALALAFSDSDDRMLFPILASREGCMELMREIARRWDFVPGATWLAMSPIGPVGTIQGLRTGPVGMIQNVGVVPQSRGKGIGKSLLASAITGYALAGIPKVQLEVSANNEGAVRLYRDMGFTQTNELFKPAATILV